MITALAISNYRSMRDVVLPLGRLNVVTGANAGLAEAVRVVLNDPAAAQQRAVAYPPT